MPRKATLLKSLTRGNIRASFNKYNLFNLYKKGAVNFRSKTLYQQKWTAKKETRAYHGEHLNEGRWQQMFQPKLESVVQLDASLRGGEVDETPYLLQTYAVLEKRLDFCLFRAMFASSIRQARQFILHGNVSVNGVTIKHPGYTLKPGDIFHINPNKVLQALGAKKPSLSESLKIDKTQILLWNKYVKFAKENPRKAWNLKMEKYNSMKDNNPEKEKYLKMVQDYKKNLEANEVKTLQECTPQYVLAQLIEVHAKSGKEIETLTIKDFEVLFHGDKSLAQLALNCYQKFRKTKKLTVELLKEKKLEELSPIAEELISSSDALKATLSDDAKHSMREGKQELSEVVKNYSALIRKDFDLKKNDLSNMILPFDPKWAESLEFHEKIDIKKLAEDEVAAQKAIKLPEQQHVYGRQNPKKSYFTPWKPRPFLSPFAILPHHIEVLFSTCHAVYLRDPVARPGHSEVITPFNNSVHQRAYMYYVRKGK